MRFGQPDVEWDKARLRSEANHGEHEDQARRTIPQGGQSAERLEFQAPSVPAQQREDEEKERHAETIRDQVATLSRLLEENDTLHERLRRAAAKEPRYDDHGPSKTYRSGSPDSGSVKIQSCRVVPLRT